jgi:hypothetical protein
MMDLKKLCNPRASPENLLVASDIGDDRLTNSTVYFQQSRGSRVLV